MHYMEGDFSEEIRAIFKPPEEVCKRYPEEQWFIETGAPPMRAWNKIQEEAYSRGYIRDTYIGPCKCMSFVVKDVVGLYRAALKKDPLELYGLN